MGKRRKPPIATWFALAGIEPLPGVRRWLERLRDAGWRQAVASSAPPANIEVIIEVLGLEDCFDGWVSAEEVAHGKPAPDVFLLAAERLGVAPARDLSWSKTRRRASRPDAAAACARSASPRWRVRSTPTSSCARSTSWTTMRSSACWRTAGDRSRLARWPSARCRATATCSPTPAGPLPTAMPLSWVAALAVSFVAASAVALHERRSRLDGLRRHRRAPCDGAVRAVDCARSGGGSGDSPVPSGSTRSASSCCPR